MNRLPNLTLKHGALWWYMRKLRAMSIRLRDQQQLNTVLLSGEVFPNSRQSADWDFHLGTNEKNKHQGYQAAVTLSLKKLLINYILFTLVLCVFFKIILTNNFVEIGKISKC